MADQDKVSKSRIKPVGSNPPHVSSEQAAHMHPGSIEIAGAEPIETSSPTGTRPENFSPGKTGGNTPVRGSASTPGSFSGSSTGAATATARSLIDQAKETAGQAYDAVTERAATSLDERKTTVSSGLSAVADSLRQAGDDLSVKQADNGLANLAARYTSTTSQKLNDVARYFEQTDVRGMVRDAENFARRNPALFIGAAFAAGILAARFLKSTPPGALGASSGQTFEPRSTGAAAGARNFETGPNPGGQRTTPNPM